MKEALQAKGVAYCIGAYVDIHGNPKAKCVPIAHFEHMMSGSELFTGYALDGLGQAPNDDEISAMPDVERLIQLPWRPEVAWLPSDNYFHGEPYPLNTRVALKRVLAEAAEMGVGMHLGVECEVYVLKLEHGRFVVPDPTDTLTKPCLRRARSCGASRSSIAWCR
jgi:glutamine synthetase